MNTPPSPTRCPKCGGYIPGEATQGLCPKCALAAVAMATEIDPRPSRAVPPTLASVAAAFPQLEILELIGTGGMGAVYKARQPKLDRWVALKLLSPSLATSAAFAERFHREARVLARLNHPGIVSVHDFGEMGGFFFLLMEFVDGVNLRQAMEAGRFTPAQALALVPRICEALQFAHDEGILHRDIKPENILLDARGRVKIVDFGIAKLLGDTTAEANLTGSGLAVGTPHYMAPEQLERPQEVDQRADIYSLGVVLYEMLTGELPIGRFAPPSQKAPMDPRVDDVVLRTLEKERERRQRTATEVKAQVETITSTRPSVPPPATAVPRAEPAVDWEPKVSACFVSTPEHLRSFRGRFVNIYEAEGELRLQRESLAFRSGWQAVTIPLRSIWSLANGDYPASAKPVPLSYLAVTHEDGGATRTLLFTPAKSALMPPWETNALVQDWTLALQEAIRRETGRTLPIERAKTAESWSWIELGKAFLLSAAGCTVAFAIVPLMTAGRLPNRLSEWMWGPLTAALSMAILLSARWWRQRMGKLTARPPELRAWERRWLRVVPAARSVVRNALILAACVLAIFFASFSVSERSGPAGPVCEWSVGAFEPWLERWHPDPGPGTSGGIALNVASTSFACGLGAFLALAVALVAFRMEAISRGLARDAAGNPPTPEGGTGVASTADVSLKPGSPSPPESLVSLEAGSKRSPCYFSSPDRMRNSFPGPQAHIFQCRGELRLEGSELVFLSPWHTRVMIPLREIRDLSLGQFQLWSTPWVMKYGRVSFLSITFGSGPGSRIVHLTPIPPESRSTAVINAEVARWFDAIRAATTALTGRNPSSSDPAAVSVSAQAGWNRRALPLLLAFGVSDALMVWRSLALAHRGPDALFVLACVGMVLFGVASAWYALGFLQANRALHRGDLDAVTSDEPPSAQDVPHERPPGGPPGPVRISWLAISSALCAIPSWLLVLGALGQLHDSLGADGLPPFGFPLSARELLVLGTGGFVGLLALFFGSAALREIRASQGTTLGARLAIIGLLGVPTGLLIRLLPPLLAWAARSFGWEPAPGQGEVFTGAVLIGCVAVVVMAAWTLRRWATGGRPDAATPRKSMRDATGWVHHTLVVVASGCLAGSRWLPAAPSRGPEFWP
ncbi:MAG: serine/threonine protein kinase [Verrucomicrobiae bacterium]|nr:serine/threonine protein kinase [Verrucomicrobiae bacterium]